MALDGITIANIVYELNETLLDGRIYKIAQPENDELLLTIKNNSTQYRLLISAGASLPFLYLTGQNKPSPMTAPNFCMLLRKHIQNGRILSITQPSLERIISIEVEHLNELGDLCRKKLMIEIMGKHSNIIFLNDNDMIIDSIKHISGAVSSVREVLPGHDYFIPQTQDKQDPFSILMSDETTAAALFMKTLTEKSLPLAKAIYTAYTGISPTIAEELCFRAQIDSSIPSSVLTQESSLHLFHHFLWVMQDVKDHKFLPNIIFDKDMPIEFASLHLAQYANAEVKDYASISSVLENYYAQKNKITRIRQKSVDLRKIVMNALERNIKKYDLQCKQLKDTEKKEKYRIYGELINAYGYQLEPECRSFEALNYYTNETITIPLDPDISPSENAKKYFDKYGKLKRTEEALNELVKETHAEIEHLESILTSMDIALLEEDLVEIKEELMECGYVKRHGSAKQKKQKITCRPFHYLSSDGFHIYVGKNNYQNEELTFKFANSGDWWFHAKGIPGSHVVLKTGGETEIPDRAFEEAGRLAAFYSKGRGQEKVEIDYTERKNVKKPNGGKPGFVVYYTNYSLMIDTDIQSLTLMDD